MIDLHMHSTYSDGTLTPAELIGEAVRRKLTAIALTDHDTTQGVPEFQRAAQGQAVRAIPGVEISAEYSGGTMHMLGYFIAHDAPALNEKLAWIREGREMRNREILQKLQALGLTLEWSEVAALAGADVVGRPHFAQAMIARGYVRDKDEAFEKYLAKGKAAYAERRRFSPADSIRLIRQAGGVAVLAHPFTLHLKPPDLVTLLGDLCGAGLQGLEVYYPEHPADAQQAYHELARRFKLVATGGTDYHGAMTPDIKMGAGFGSLAVPDEVVDRLLACVQAAA